MTNASVYKAQRDAALAHLERELVTSADMYNDLYRTNRDLEAQVRDDAATISMLTTENKQLDNKLRVADLTNSMYEEHINGLNGRDWQWGEVPA